MTLSLFSNCFHQKNNLDSLERFGKSLQWDFEPIKFFLIGAVLSKESLYCTTHWISVEIRSISTMRHYATFGINPWGPNYKFSWVLFPRKRLTEFPITTNYSIATYPCKIFSVSNHAKNKYATPRSGELFFETPMQNNRWKM